jgi:serine/threonine-protein phosphatase 4 regulatory subunit 1
MGPQSWSKLKHIHELFVKDSRWRVRRSLAFSLHEVAKIIGPELTESELLPVLYHFLKDIKEVKEGALSTLPKFIKEMTMS